MVKSAAARAGSAVPTASDDVLPSATDVMKQVAEIEAKKASDYLRKQKAEQAEKKALIKDRPLSRARLMFSFGAYAMIRDCALWT